MDVITVMLCGVGGQGTILAADLLAKVATASGLDVKLSEVHGMAQRGGSVDTVVRFGDQVFSPVSDPGCVDHLVAFEMTEALRRVQYLAPQSRLLVDCRTIDPLPVLTGDAASTTDPIGRLREYGAVLIDAGPLACEAGSPRSANVVLMGALSVGLPFSVESWSAVIAGRVPAHTVEANLRAFELGRRACQEGECRP